MTHDLYKTQKDIETWLNEYGINNYKLIEDKDYGYIVNVNNSVKLSSKKIKEIKIKFNIINGDFNCSDNNLKTLKGCPKIVNGSFYCSYNKLKTLEYCPEIIKEDFNCNENELKSLKGCIGIIDGNFYCAFNKLDSLYYFPNNIKGNCILNYNSKLKDIQKVKNFEELYRIHKKEVSNTLNEKLEKEITIDNPIKNAKIKL